MFAEMFYGIKLLQLWVEIIHFL